MKVGVAAAGSGTQVSVRMILKHYNIKADEYELNVGQSAQRLADGQIDAFFYAAGTPLSALIQLGSTKGFDLYSFFRRAKSYQQDNPLLCSGCD